MGVLKNDVGRPSNKTIRTRNILKFLGIILVIGLAFIGGYKLSNSSVEQKTTAEQNRVKKEVLDINSKEVLDLYVPFSFHMYNMEEEELFEKNKITVNDLSVEYKNRLAYAYYINEVGIGNIYNIYNEELEDYSGFDSSKFENYYKNFFGKNETYIPKTFDSYGIDSIETIYEKEKDCYWTTQEGGDHTYSRYGNELYRAEKIGNKIVLYINVVVYNSDYNSNDFGVFKNIDDAKNFKNSIKVVNLEEFSNAREEEIEKVKKIQTSKNTLYVDDLSEYKDSASKYKITLEKEAENYIFRQIEKTT